MIRKIVTVKQMPERPIISQTGSNCKEITNFVERHVSHISKGHETYIQDTQDVLRELQKINSRPKLDSYTLLLTMDVKTHFTNIYHKNGMGAMKEKLN